MILGVESLEKVSGIYCAIHRETGACYVGSSINVGRRRREHLKASRAGKNSCFAKALRLHGESSFDFEILERCQQSELLRREEFYIALFGSASAGGFNTRTRACAPYDYRHSSATKERIGVAMKGRKLSPLTRSRMSASMVGKKKGPMSAAHKAAIAAGNSGQKRSEEACMKMSILRTGEKRTEEAKAKMRLAKLGKKLSAEHRKNIGAALSIAKTGVKQGPLSEEHKQKLREAHARRRAALIKGVIAAPVSEAEKSVDATAAEA